MPATFTVSSGSERVVVVNPERSRTSSGGSASIRSPGSSGSYSGGSDSWSEVEAPYEGDDDGIEPSDSASRSRQPSRHETEARPAPVRRHSSRRITQPREESPPRHRSHRKHHSSRHRRADSRRVPSDESSSTVASRDDYPYNHHGMPPPRGYPPQSRYQHPPAAPVPPSHGGYPPSMTSAPGYDAFTAQQAMVHIPQQDAFGYPSSNPFTPQGQPNNPFSPMSASGQSSYFAADPHAPTMPHHPRPPGPPRPQSYMAPSSHYGSEMMSPYAHPAMSPYSGYGMQHPGYPPMPAWYPPPPTHASPPPPSVSPDNKDDKKSQELESLKALIQKHEEARLAREQEMLKQREADAAAAAAAKAQEEAEKKKKEEIAAASKQAKEDAEKKAAEAAKKLKEEHEKKLKEADAAKADAEKKHKEAEAEAEKLRPAPDMTKPPIKFKDAVGRKFSFPFHLCKTWKGMEGLIRQAFLHVEMIGEHVLAGHYDLQGPDGEIILPQVWETMIQPDWEISMHMWPMPEAGEKKEDKLAQDAAAMADPFAALGLGDLGLVDKKPKKKGSKKDRKGDSHIVDVPVGGGIPPPPGFIPGLPDPLGMAGMYPPGVSPVDDKKGKPKRSGSQKPKSKSDAPGFAAWFAGSGGKRSKK